VFPVWLQKARTGKESACEKTGCKENGCEKAFGKEGRCEKGACEEAGRQRQEAVD
jgi:hypothetical protein